MARWCWSWSGAVLSLLIVGHVALQLGHAAAQEPPSPQPVLGTITVLARCTPTIGELQRRFAVQLADALGTTPAAVLTALDRVAERVPPRPLPPDALPAPGSLPTIVMETAASLGVAPQTFTAAFDAELRSAMTRAQRSAMECPPCPPDETCEDSGPLAITALDTQFLGDIAQSLGGDLGAEPVQDVFLAALRDARPTPLRVNQLARQQALDEQRAQQVRALAEALAISEDDLRAALQGIDVPLIIRVGSP